MKRIGRRLFCKVGLAGFLLTANIQAVTYYVGTDGSDSNAGSRVAPFRHLSRASAAARQPGDTVVVMDGTYDNEGQVANSTGGGSVVPLNYSGTALRRITFRALNRGKVILDAMNTSGTLCNGAWAYFDLKNASYILIQGFVIQNGCYNGIRSNDRAHDITIKWNEIRNIGNWANPGGQFSPSGIYLNSDEYNFTFDGNVFHDIGGGTTKHEQAIYTSASNVTIINNIFYNNTHGWGIQTAGGNTVLIANNTFAFSNPSNSGQVILWDNNSPGSLANITIRNNIFYSAGQTAVMTNLMGPIAGNCTVDHNITDAGTILGDDSPCTVRSNQTNTNPKIVDTSTPPYDFHLQQGSPAIRAGASVPALSTDFDGAPRSSSAIDIGAYAFLPATRQPISEVTNGATFMAGPVAPGEVVAIFGSGIGPQTGAGLSLDASGMVDTLLGNTRALFDGVAAPMVYASALQVVAVVPYAVAGRANTSVEVEFDGTKSPAFDLQVSNSAPGIFTMSSSGRGQGAILNQDFSPNSAGNPAAKGSVVLIYGTGQGQTSPAGGDGLLASDDLQTPVLPVSVSIGGHGAAVLYAGSAPGLVSGALQINARVPTAIASGAQVPVVITVGSNSSAPGVTMSVM